MRHRADHELGGYVSGRLRPTGASLPPTEVFATLCELPLLRPSNLSFRTRYHTSRFTVTYSSCNDRANQPPVHRVAKIYRQQRLSCRLRSGRFKAKSIQHGGGAGGELHDLGPARDPRRVNAVRPRGHRRSARPRPAALSPSTPPHPPQRPKEEGIPPPPPPPPSPKPP